MQHRQVTWQLFLMLFICCLKTYTFFGSDELIETKHKRNNFWRIEDWTKEFFENHKYFFFHLAYKN